MKLPEWAKWLARDKDGVLYAFEKKPIKSGVAWHIKDDDDDYRIMSETDDTFSHIKWIDEEPTKVKRVTGLGLATSDKYNRITIAKAHGYDEVPEVADLVNHPNHYKQGGLETIDIMQALLPHEQFIGYLKGNIIKYRERAEHKGNAEQDYAKAKWYYDKLIEHTEG